MSDALSLKVSTTENEIMKKLRVGVSSIKDNLAKLHEELIDNDELQEKLDGLTSQFHIKYDDFKQKIKLQAMQDAPPLQLYPASDKFLM